MGMHLISNDMQSTIKNVDARVRS